MRKHWFKNKIYLGLAFAVFSSGFQSNVFADYYKIDLRYIGSENRFLGAVAIDSIDPANINEVLNKKFGKLQCEKGDFAYLETPDREHYYVARQNCKWSIKFQMPSQNIPKGTPQFDDPKSLLMDVNPYKCGTLWGKMFVVIIADSGRRVWCPYELTDLATAEDYNWLGLSREEPKTQEENSYYLNADGWIYEYNNNTTIWMPHTYIGPEKGNDITYACTYMHNPINNHDILPWTVKSPSYLRNTGKSKPSLFLPAGSYKLSMSSYFIPERYKIQATFLITNVNGSKCKRGDLVNDFESDSVIFKINEGSCGEIELSDLNYVEKITPEGNVDDLLKHNVIHEFSAPRHIDPWVSMPNPAEPGAKFRSVGETIRRSIFILPGYRLGSRDIFIKFAITSIPDVADNCRTFPNLQPDYQGVYFSTKVVSLQYESYVYCDKCGLVEPKHCDHMHMKLREFDTPAKPVRKMNEDEYQRKLAKEWAEYLKLQKRQRPPEAPRKFADLQQETQPEAVQETPPPVETAEREA